MVISTQKRFIESDLAWHGGLFGSLQTPMKQSPCILISLSATLKSYFGNVLVELEDFFRKYLQGGDSLCKVAFCVH